MTDLHARLQAFFGASTTRMLARVAPLTFLAGGIGTTIAAVIARPEFATSGWGVVLGGLAVNLTSSLIYDIVNAPSDDARAQIVEQGIEHEDRDVLTLSAAALVAAGPDLAQALPETSSRELIDGLEHGMRQAGGPLERLAPRYAGALREPNADWAALRDELTYILSVEQTIDIGEDALNQDSGQRVEHADGPVKQSITIARGGKNIGSSQVVIGSGRHDAQGSPDDAGAR